jgi:hypothetical protein
MKRGLRPGEELVGIDFRPRDGRLYGVGSKDSGAVLYRIDPETGVATAVAPLGQRLGRAGRAVG